MRLKNPEALASDRQKWKLRQLTGEDTRDLDISMQEASDRIEGLELTRMGDNPVESSDLLRSARDPFTEAHVTIIEGAQRSGKTNIAVGRIVDSYFKDCVRIFCEEVLKLKNFKIKAYYPKERLAKIQHEDRMKILKIPANYKLHSPMRIFANFHIFGIPAVYIPTFHHLLYWLKTGIIRDGWVVIDEAHLGINARASMTSLGKELESMSFQYGKMQLDVIIITHMAKLIDWAIRTIPTEWIHCTYDKNTRVVNYEVRKKGQNGTAQYSVYAPQYWGYYWTNERINA